jgi:hypothetical protein
MQYCFEMSNTYDSLSLGNGKKVSKNPFENYDTRVEQLDNGKTIYCVRSFPFYACYNFPGLSEDDTAFWVEKVNKTIADIRKSVTKNVVFSMHLLEHNDIFSYEDLLLWDILKNSYAATFAIFVVCDPSQLRELKSVTSYKEASTSFEYDTLHTLAVRDFWKTRELRNICTTFPPAFIFWTKIHNLQLQLLKK